MTADIPILSKRIDNPVDIRPVHNFILVQKLDDEENIIQLPDGVTNPLQQWNVLAVAPDTTVVKIGDHVLLMPDARIVKIDGERHIGMIPVNAVIGIVA